MFKKLLVASAVLAVSSTAAFASVGPYVGLSLGADNSSWHVGTSDSSVVTSDGLAFHSSDSFGNDLGSHGIVGSIFAGYGMLVNPNIYLGGEIFANLASTTAKINSSDSFSIVDVATGTTIESDSSSFSDKLSTRGSYGVSFIPGWMLSNDTMIFGRIGVIETRFDHTLSFLDTSTTEHNNVTGGQLGLGLQTSVTPHVDIRGEYVYTAYQSFSSFGEDVDARNNQVNFSLIYKFC